MKIGTEILTQIVAAGIRAPSADNSQPWKFRLFESGIQIELDPTRVGMFFDAVMAASHYSLGAVCENMLLEAGRLGFAAQLRPLDVAFGALSIGFVLELKKDGGIQDSLANHIDARMTHRGLFRRSKQVEASVLNEIKTVLPENLGCQVEWPTGATSRKALMRAVYLADLVRFTHPIIHHDFHEKLRFGRAAESSRDGLGASTLGIEAPLLPILRLLRPWSLSNALNCIGLKHVMAWRGGWLPMWSAPVLGVITANNDVDYFDMGRALERVWLAATQAGLAFQPMGALPLLLVRANSAKGDGLSARHVQMLRQADNLWRQSIGPANTQRQLIMIFRIGHAHTPAPRAYRRYTEDFWG